MELNKNKLNPDSIDELKAHITTFCEMRDWDQFHTPKDLAIGLVTEAAELLDLFRFKTEVQVQELLRSEKGRQRLEEEMADCLFFIMRMSSRWNMNLGEILLKKMEVNNQKYPVDKYRGRNLKYDEE